MLMRRFGELFLVTTLSLPAVVSAVEPESSLAPATASPNQASTLLNRENSCLCHLEPAIQNPGVTEC